MQSQGLVLEKAKKIVEFKTSLLLLAKRCGRISSAGLMFKEAVVMTSKCSFMARDNSKLNVLYNYVCARINSTKII